MVSQLESWLEELREYRLALGRPMATRYEVGPEQIRAEARELRGDRDELWSIEDLAMVARAVEDLTEEIRDSQLLGVRHLLRARKAAGPRAILEDHTPWTRQTQRLLIDDLKAKGRSWRGPARARAAVTAVKDLEHNPLIVIWEIYAVMKHLDAVRRQLRPWVRRLAWELAIVDGLARQQIADGCDRPVAWVNKQIRDEQKALGPLEERRLYEQARRERLLHQAPGQLRLVH